MKSRPTLAAFLAASPLLMGAETVEHVDVKTVREIIGEVSPLAHAFAQFRTGYIHLDDKNGQPDSSAFALGGHLHLDTKRWFGLALGLEGYAVINPGFNSEDPDKIDSDFFDHRQNGFATLSQAFLDGRWGETELKIGRQMVDTPHIDSDDIRMMPNYFEASILTNRDIENLTLQVGYVDKMAGWENGVDAKRFIPVSRVLGAQEARDGVLFASAAYEGFDNLSIQGWVYGFENIADLLYLEAGYEHFGAWGTATVGVQFDRAVDKGAALLGSIDARSWGVSLQLTPKKSGWSLLAAYNADEGSGAFPSLGGGPFFTSLEILTLDAIASGGYAYSAGVGYDFSGWLGNLDGGIVHGRFRADDKARFDSGETDLILRYRFSDRFHATAAYAVVDDRSGVGDDFDQFRLIANYDFPAL
ncbi:OprD family outer membrane porin [Hydrogenimonas sp.]